MRARITVVTCVAVAIVGVPAAGGAAPTGAGRLIPVAGARSLMVAGDRIWVTTPTALVQVDPARRTVVTRTRFPHIVSSAAIDGRLVWVLTGSRSPGTGLLYSVDIATGRSVGAPISLAPLAQGRVLAAGGSLWVTNADHGTYGRLFRIDPRARTVVGRVRIPDDPDAAVFAHGALWVGESDAGMVTRVDARTGKIEGRPIRVGGALLELATARGRIWVAQAVSGRLAALDASTGRVIGNRRRPGVSGVAASGGTVWTWSWRAGAVSAFDEGTGRQTLARTRVPGGVEGVAVHGRSVWVVNARGITPLAP
jgi:outer membrane protein assembly factor BamB